MKKDKAKERTGHLLVSDHRDPRHQNTVRVTPEYTGALTVFKEEIVAF